ncbi:hypothetical protein D9615_008228 [Tricholomella constricta]|uniref:DUF6534 domain-containing protein n=1 Tax=Tricholomella constricta TaxID=117010 RepID=A0A8H5H3V8_9AGAR|nr:hypothetical protein D9615_008228 [Tricholomella constricta]
MWLKLGPKFPINGAVDAINCMGYGGHVSQRQAESVTSCIYPVEVSHLYITLLFLLSYHQCSFPSLFPALPTNFHEFQSTSMSSSAETMPSIDLSETFAPIFWGFVISLFLGGITIVQAYIYFPSEKDRLLVRVTAASMILFDLASSFLIAQSVYYYLIPNFGSLVPLNSVTPEISAECLLSTMITFNSQMYFVYQLYSVKRMGRSRWLVLGSITACAVMAFAGGIACVATMYIFHSGVLSHRNGTFAIFFGVAKGFGAATDVLATIAMCMYLTSSKTGITETNTLLNKLMQFVIHRGALVTLIQTLLLITFYAAPRKLYWLAFHINVTKLYANTFFAMLNGRNHLQDNWNTRSALAPSFNGTHHSQKFGFRNEQYDLRTLEIQENDGSTESKHMPTVTKTVEVSNI